MTPTRRDRAWLVGLTAGALVVRIAVALLGDRDDLGFNDQFIYHHLAEGLADGDGFAIFGAPTVRWLPAFPFLLSLVYRVGPADPLTGMLATAVLSTAAVPAVFLLGRACADRRVAILAAGAIALLPGQWLFAATILTEPLASLEVLLALAVAVVLRPGWRAAVVLAAVVAIGVLTRGEGALLLATPLVVWWTSHGVRRTVGTVGLAAAIAAVAVLPWAVRNERAAGEFVGLSLNAGETLYAGHNPRADGGATYAPPELIAPALDLPLGPEREILIAEITRDAARTWAREHPKEEVALVPKRLAHLAEGDGNVVTIWIEAQEPALSPFSRAFEAIADAGWYLLLGLFAVCGTLRWRTWLSTPWMRGALVLPLLSLPLYGIVFYGNFRYRVPYEPSMVLVTAASLDSLIRSRRAGPSSAATP